MVAMGIAPIKVLHYHHYYMYPLVSKVHAGSLRVSARYPPISDMDYKIFNYGAYVIILMHTCAYIHTGLEHTDSESAQHNY